MRAETQALESIDQSSLIDLVMELVKTPTLSAHEAPGQELVTEILRSHGIDVETWSIDIPALATSAWYSAEVERSTGLGVLARMGQRQPGEPTLLLNGHIDVVPTGDPSRWTSPPFSPEVRDGRIYGRGTCDMKGGLAAAMHALHVIKESGVQLRGEVMLASVIGEEDGGCGTLALLERGIRADACIIPEPTGLDVVPAVAGALSWRLHVSGQSAHGCLREEGVSALERFMPLHRAVLELERTRNERTHLELFNWLDRPYAICGGRIVGGDWPSSEMDWLMWEGRYGVSPGEDLDAARAEFEDVVNAAAATDSWLALHPPRVEWWGGRFYPGATDTNAAIVTTMKTAAADTLGRTPQLRGMPYGCDLGLTVNAGGMPTVVFGPGNVRDAHRPNESVPIDDLVAVTQALVRTIVRHCGVV